MKVTLGDLLPDSRDLRGAPDVDREACIPSLAGKPHGHFLCDAWRRGDFAAAPETRAVQALMDGRYELPRRAF